MRRFGAKRIQGKLIETLGGGTDERSQIKVWLRRFEEGGFLIKTSSTQVGDSWFCVLCSSHFCKTLLLQMRTFVGNPFSRGKSE
jgi:hypothetical protein